MSPEAYQNEHADVIASVEHDRHDGFPLVRFRGVGGGQVAVVIPGGWQMLPDPAGELYRPLLDALARRRGEMQRSRS